MKNALAFAVLLALATSPAAAACYGGPALQTCHDVDGDRSTGITTMRGYNAQSGSRWNETVKRPGKVLNRVVTNGHRSAQTNQAEPDRQARFYTCTPYSGCR
jgi:hypothetical protein